MTTIVYDLDKDAESAPRFVVAAHNHDMLKKQLAEQSEALLRETDRTQDAWRKQWALEARLADAEAALTALVPMPEAREYFAKYHADSAPAEETHPSWCLQGDTPGDRCNCGIKKASPENGCWRCGYGRHYCICDML